MNADASDPVAEEIKRLQGQWQAVEQQTKGEKRLKDDPSVRDLQFAIEGEELVVRHVSREGAGRRKTIKLDPSKSPKEIDLTSHDGVESGQTAAAIYKLEGDRLTICLPYWTNDPTTRPREFRADDDVLMLYVLERVKSK
jgi:uncharacterized protein (TIGR03067 family)